MKRPFPANRWLSGLAGLLLLLAAPGRTLAQTVQLYSFTAFNDAYSSLGTSAARVSVNGGGGTTDDGYSVPIALPFNFQFGAAWYNTVTLTSNGYLGFGTHTTAANYNVLRGTENNVVAFCNTNLSEVLGTVPITWYGYTTTGTAPNRIFKIEANTFQRASSFNGRTGNAQVWLYETSHRIELRYGAFGTGWSVNPPVAVFPDDSVRVGLRGVASNDMVAVRNSWVSPVTTSALSAGLRLSAPNQDLPASGRVFRFTPPALLPSPDFTASAQTVNVGSAVTFTDQTLNQPTNWQWTFSPNTVTFVGGTSATSQNPQVTFNSPGCYTVTLTASNNSGSNPVVKTDYVCAVRAACTPLHVAGCDNYYVNSVAIANTTLRNIRTGCGANNSPYTVWPASGTTTATLTAGQTYTLQVATLPSTAGSTGAWLDYDGDGNFAASEFINLGLNTSQPFTIPNASPAGQVRLRIRKASTTLTAADACTAIFGETEDYFVTLLPGCNVPKPDATYNSPLCAGEDLVLTVNNPQTGTSYFWTGPAQFFASGATVTRPGVNGQMAGQYIVTAQVGNCNEYDTAFVSIGSVPTAPSNFSAGRCGPGSVTLTVTTGVGTGYRWYTQAQGGSPIAGQSSATYTTPSLTTTTTYYVSVVGRNGCESARATATAQINSAPNATLTANGPTTFCQGGFVVLQAGPTGRNANGAPLFTYAWERNGTPLTGRTSDTLEVHTGGQYKVLVTEIATTCAASAGPVTVTVNPQTTATFSYGQRTYCQNGTDPSPTISGTSGGTFSATPTGLVIDAQTGTIDLSASAAGSYVVTYAVGGQCPSSATRGVFIQAAPGADFSYDTNSVCQLTDGTIAPSFFSGAAPGVFSASPTGLSLNAQTGEITPSASQPGTYTVTNTVFGGTQCPPSQATTTFTIRPNPSATITASGNTTFCQGGSVTLTAPAGQSAYLWSTGATTPSITVTTSGNYWVKVTNGVGCATTSADETVTVLPRASATFSYGAASYCRTGAPNPTPTITGTQGGTFSSAPTGLALNAQTGQITLFSSVPGTYTVSYTAGGRLCPDTQSQTVTITNGQSAVFGYGPTGGRCAGTAGTIAPTLATGATAGTFSATPSGLSLNATTGVIDLSASTAGTYTITNFVAAANGCAAASDTANVTLRLTPPATITPSGPTTFCQGGSVTLTGPGTPTFGYSYLWSTGARTQSITVSTSGNYTVTVTAPNGCSATSAVTTVTVLPQPSAAFNYSSQTYCQTGADPTPTITGTQGGSFSANPSGLVINAQTGTIDLSASATGTFRITYAVGGQCPASQTQSITIVPAPAAGFSYNPDGTPCQGSGLPIVPFLDPGATAGTFSATPAGLSLNAQTGEIDLNASAAGTYQVTNTVAGNQVCAGTSATVSFTVLPTPNPTITASGPTTFCAGGSVTLTAVGGGANASVVWSNGATTRQITVTQSGQFSVTITNASGCGATSATTTVSVVPQASAAFNYGNSTYCQSAPSNPTPTITGTQGGVFSATPTGLTLNQQTGQITLFSSAPGTYSVSYAVGGRSCPDTQTQTVTISPAPSALFGYGPTGSRCVGTNGTLTPTLAQGATAGAFSSSPAGLSLNAQTGAINLATSQPGTYTITNTVAANNGCAAASDTANVTLRATPPATITASGATTFCQGGSVTLSGPASPPTFAYGYQWSNGATTQSITVSTSGNYTVTVTAPNGCSATSAVTTVTVLPQPSAAFNYSSQTYCQTGADPTPTITGTQGGSFSANPSGLVINAQTGTIDLSASATGTFRITYAVGGQCPASQTQSITIVPAPSAGFSYNPDGTPCQGSGLPIAPFLDPGATAGTFSATPAGLSLNAQTGEIDLNASAAGTYQVTNTVAGNQVCAGTSATVSFTVLPTPNPTITASGPTTFCAGGSVTLTAVGGGANASVVWSNGATTRQITVTQSGQFSVTITNASGCGATSATTTVLVVPQASAAFNYGNSTYCQSAPSNPTPTITGTQGGVFSATPTGLTLNTQTGQITLFSSAPGTYSVSYAVGGRSCPDTQTQTVTISPAPSALFGYGPTGSRCVGTNGTLTPVLAQGATAGTFSSSPAGLTLNTATGQINLATSQPGTYTITNTVAANNGCAAASDTANVTLRATPPATITASGATTFCQGGSVTLNGPASTGNFSYSYQWSNGATTPSITVSTGGNYTLTVTAPNGCSATSAVTTVTVLPQPSAAFNYSSQTYCQTGADPTPTITGTQGGSFSANPSGLVINAQTGTIDLSASATGTFRITYAVTGQCPASQTTSLTITTAPSAAFNYPSEGPYCTGAQGTLAPDFPTGTTPGTFSATPAGLTINAATGVVTLATSQPGIYTVTNTVPAQNGCAATSATAQVTISNTPSATITASGNTTFCQGGSVTLSAPAGQAGYLWSNGATTPSITVSAGGQYSVTVTNQAGCATTSVATTVTVQPQASAAFAYRAGSFCRTGTPNPVPTVTGTQGGTFSATPAGLSLDGQTGQINLAASTPGSYTVTYSVGGPCPAAQSASVTITPGQLAAFGYASNAPLCAGNAGTLAPTLASGATAGTFSATPSGLSLTATSGVIDLAGSQPGTYTVTNAVAAANGCAATSATAQVTIQALPTPTISANGNTTFCQGGSVTLSASGGTSYVWSNGATTPSITVSSSGQFSVTATNAAGCSATSAVTTVTVVPQASAAFAYGAASYCQSGAPNPTPTISGTPGGTFSAAPTGLTLDAQTGQLTLASSQPGTYTVTYSVGGRSCPDTRTQTVTITPPPTAGFSYPTNTPLCAGNAGTLTPTLASGATAGTFSATPSGLSLNAATGAINLATSQPGTYTVTNSLAAANGCAAVAGSTQVTINALPQPTVRASGATTFCQGGAVTLSATGGTSFLWSTGDQTPSITVSASGQYSVTVTNQAGCSATSAPVTVTVTPQASAAFGYASSTYCLTGANPTPTVTGNAGGTFTAAPSGLVLSATTGTINLAASAPGSYVVTYTVGGQCPASADQTITLTNAPSAAFTYPATTAPPCAGGAGTLAPSFGQGASAGTFTATPGGLTINPGTGVITLANSQPGTYTVTNTIAAANGCAASSATATVVVRPTPTATITASGATTFCQGGSVTLTASTGASYLWSNGATTPSITVSTSGQYSVTVTNQAGCSATSAATTVTVQPQASATFSYASPSYCRTGTANPTPTVTGNQGGTFAATPAGLSLNAQTGEITLGSSQPGTYQVTYSVGGPCPDQQTRPVVINAAPTAGFSYASNSSLCAGNTGTLTPTLASGATAGTFSASPSGLSITATSGVIDLAGSQPGTYTVTNAVAAANGCAATSATAQVTLQALPTASISASGNTTFCQGDSLTLTASGGTSYVWSNGATTPSITVSASGQFSVTVTNQAGCSATSAAATVTVLPQASAAFSYATSTFCVSGSNPVPTVTGAQGGTFSASPNGLSIAATSGTINLANSTPGTYTVTYSVNGQCPATQSQTVTITNAPSATFSYNGSTTGNVPCAGSAGTISPSFGTGASAGTFSATPAGLTINASTGVISLATSQPGTYTVTNTIAAGNGCSASSAAAQVTINATPTATISASGNTTFCAGGSVTLTASNGASYLWSNGATTPSITVSASGQFSVTVTNQAGCSATSAATTVTVLPQASAAFSYATSTFCVSGSNPVPTVTGAQGGTFSATPSGLSIAATSGVINLANSTPGTYTVTYSVGGQCPATQSQTVTITNAPSASFTYSGSTTGNVPCAGSAGTISPNFGSGASAGTFSATPAGLTINASTGVISLATSQPGTYTVTNTIAAGNGCSASSAAAQVTINAAPTATISASGNTTFCQGGSVTLTASNGTSYLWSNGATTPSITVSASGQFSVTVTNQAGCSATSAATTVTVLPQASAAFSYATSTFCVSGSNPVPTVTGAQGGTFSATPSGLSIAATSGTINLANSTPGTYTVTYSVNGQCPASQSQTVTITNAPSASFTYSGSTTGNLPCAGSAGTISPSFGTGASAGTFSATPAGLTIDPSSGVISLATSQPGTYTVTNAIAAGNGCSASSATAQVTINATPIATISASGNTTFCQGGSVTLTASAGTSYLWSNGATTPSITVSASGQFSVTVTNQAGCSATSAATTVTVLPQASAAFSYTTSTFCVSGSNPVPTVTGAQGGTFSATPSGLSIAATNGTINLANSTPGTYTVTYSVNGQCPASQSQTVTITNAPSASFSYSGSTTGTLPCAGSAGTISPNFGSGASAGTFSATPAGLTIDPSSGVISLATSQPGTYTVTNTIAAGNGCSASSATAQVTINATPTATISASGNTTFCAGGSVTLTASAGTSYLWSNGATTPSITVSASGQFSVTVTNAAGCSATSAATTVTVLPQASAAFSYTTSTFCVSGSNPVPTVTGAQGGTFSATPSGLSIDPTSGIIDLTASAPGTYTVTYTVAGPCGDSQSQTVTITNAPLAGFTYGGPRVAVFCAGSTGTLSPILDAGAVAGTFTAVPAGLTLDPTTGAIDLTSSQPGTYSVTNTVAASGGCAAATATTTITLQALPVATITPGGPTTFCQGGSVLLTASGGTSYVWSNGATTPSITVTATGTFSVVASNGGCVDTSAVVSVTVNPQASATFGYGNATFCASGTNPTPTITGTTGGTFSASGNGLVIDPATGEIDLSASTAGTYTVTYTVGGPCGASQTTTVTITNAPTASFSYGGPRVTVFCAGTTGTLTPILDAGAIAGAFTATPTGLSLDPVTGEIDLSTSQPGTYTVTNTVAASGGCAATTASTTITLEALPVATISASGNTTFCQGDSVTLTASTGASYLWSNGATTPSITVSTSGQFSVVVTNAAGCEATSQATTVTVNPQASATFGYGTTTLCASGPNPTPTVTGNAGGTFSASGAGLVIDPVTGEIDLTASTAGTYTVTYSVGGPCPATQTQTVTITPAPNGGFTYGLGRPTTVPCTGTTGTLSPILDPGAVAGTFSAAPTGLTLDPTTGDIDLSTSQPGTYVVTNTIGASGGCATVIETDTITLSAPPTPVITAGGPTTFCQGDSVVLTATGGASYLWSNGATTPSITVTTAGQYSVVATSTAGCEGTSAPITITVNPLTAATFGYGAASYCASGVNPTPTVTGTPGGTFSASAAGLVIDPVSGEINLSASTAGTYTVTYSVGGPCPAQQTQTVTITDALSGTFSYGGPRGISNAPCAGSTGTLSADLAPGATAGTFSATPTGLTLDPATGAIDLATSQPGTYVVTNFVAAANGCAATTATDTITLHPLPTPTITAGGPTTFCQGGSVVLTATGGASYLWSNGATTPSITVTTAGQYSVVATSAAGCEGTSAPITITVNPQASAAFGYGAASYCASGVNPTPTVTGTPGGTFSASGSGLVIDPTTGEIDLTASTAGTYTVTYAVGGPCPATQTTTVTITNAPTGGFSYGGPRATVFCAGATGTLTPTLETGAVAGTFSAAPTGLTLNPTTGVVNLATSQPGTYVVTNTIGASGGCAAVTATDTITLQAPPTATVTASGPLAFCPGDSVVLTATGGASYLWSNGATTPSITVSAAGQYSVTATNAAGCEATSAPLTVTLLPQPSAAFAYNGTIFCASSPNQTPTITGAPGGTFTVTPAGLVLNPTTGQIRMGLSALGTYTITYTVGGNCPASQSVTVSIISTPNAGFDYGGPRATVFCAGASGTLSPIFLPGAVAGVFSAVPTGLALNPTTGVVNLATSQPGTYIVTNRVTAAGCGTAVDTDTITLQPLPTASVVASGPLSFCPGDSVVLTASGGASYLWSNGATTPSITVRATSALSVVVTNAGGCADTSAVVNVTVSPGASAAFSYSLPTYCLAGGTATPTITGATGGTFSAVPAGLVIDPATGAIDLAASAAGTYTVTYTVGGSCAASQTQPITLSPAPQAAMSYPIPGGCAGVAGILTPTLGTGATAGTFGATPTGLTLDPATGAIDLATSLPGVYTVTNIVAGNASCAADTSTATITVLATPTVVITGLDTTYCLNDPAVNLTGTINGIGGGTFTVDGQPATVFDPAALGAGPHTVVFTGTLGNCGASVTAVVNVVAPPAQPTFTAQTLPNGHVVLTSSSPTGNQWFLNGNPIPGATGPTYTLTDAAQNGTYTVVVSAGGCVSPPSAPQTVTVNGLGADLAVGASLQLFPNPTADGQVTVALKGFRQTLQVGVYDAVGRLVRQVTLLPAADLTTTEQRALDLHDLPTGVYAVRFRTDQGTAVRRLVRE